MDRFILHTLRCYHNDRYSKITCQPKKKFEAVFDTDTECAREPIFADIESKQK